MYNNTPQYFLCTYVSLNRYVPLIDWLIHADFTYVCTKRPGSIPFILTDQKWVRCWEGKKERKVGRHLNNWELLILQQSGQMGNCEKKTDYYYIV